MEHGNGANFTGSESWYRGGLEAIFKLRNLFQRLAQKVEEKSIYATKRHVWHSRLGKERDVLNYIKGNPQLEQRRLSE